MDMDMGMEVEAMEATHQKTVVIPRLGEAAQPLHHPLHQVAAAAVDTTILLLPLSPPLPLHPLPLHPLPLHPLPHLYQAPFSPHQHHPLPLIQAPLLFLAAQSLPLHWFLFIHLLHASKFTNSESITKAILH